MHKVYKDKDNCLYSEGVKRVFGENRRVTIGNDVFLVSVMPLMCNPEECGLLEVGTINE